MNQKVSSPHTVSGTKRLREDGFRVPMSVQDPQVNAGIGEYEGGCRSTFYLIAGKRLFDLVLGTLALTAALPLLFVCAAAIRLESEGPVLFRQRRVGQHGKLFDILKLRTMVDGAHRNGPKLTVSGDKRITTVGKWLRRAKIDELPQLLNVLRGEMSLVGPRPEFAEYVSAYNHAQRFVLELKPGITGRASLAFIQEEKILANQPETEHFYLSVVMPQKLDYDLSYCRSVSFGEDLNVILTTLGKLLHL
jgi:lipopolysaccharide/colanic/teichoic acid biosynthesis glycosyltransferase